MSASPQELNLLDLLDALTKDRIQAWAEALLLTFNFEASFFEGRVLGRLRALGARVAVLASAFHAGSVVLPVGDVESAPDFG